MPPWTAMELLGGGTVFVVGLGMLGGLPNLFDCTTVGLA